MYATNGDFVITINNTLISSKKNKKYKVYSITDGDNLSDRQR